MSTRARLRNEHYQPVFRNSEATSITNSNGVVILSGLPLSRVSVAIEGVEKPLQNNLQSGKPTELVVTVNRKAASISKSSELNDEAAKNMLRNE